MAVIYPVDCDSPRKKTEWLYRAQELLRSIHNVFSKWLHEGLIEVEYNKLPQKIKDKYPYVVKLSKKNWDKFIKEDFCPRSDKVCTEINIQRKMFKEATTWSIDVGEL